MKKIYHSGTFSIGKILLLIAGFVGICLVVSSLIFFFSGAMKKGKISEQYPSNAGLIIPGVLLCIAFFPGLYLSGIELDSKRKRLRLFSGLLGKDKGHWVDVHKTDYLSAVLVSESRSGGAMGWAPSVSMAKGRIYLFQEDGHLELFSGYGSRVDTVLKQLSQIFQLPINDVRNDQNVDSMGQSGVA